MDIRKRPRLDPSPNDDIINSTTSSSSSPATGLLQTQIATLRTQLTHAQSMRSLERKSHNLNEERLKRQLADAHLEMEQQREISEGMRREMDQMEERMNGWVEMRAREAEELQQSNLLPQINGDNDDDDALELQQEKCHLLQQRLDATSTQVQELTKLLRQSQEMAAASELKASNALLQLSQVPSTAAATQHVDENQCNPAILRTTRVKLAESERCHRETTRQNKELKARLQDMVQYKEKAGLAQRKVQQLEKEVQLLQHRVESGEEVERRWMEIRRELVEEDLVIGEEECATAIELTEPFSVNMAGIPPEIATVVRKFRGLKHHVQKLKEENTRLLSVSEERSKRCSQFEKHLKDRNEAIASLEKEVKTANDTISHLELENRKIMAQQDIWKRESEGMRSLLDTYEMQETNNAMTRSKQSSKPGGASSQINKLEDISPTVKGLELSLQSARDEIKLLSETNQRLESEIDSIKSQHQNSQREHERVLEKFGKLRSALMEERSKAQASEERACKAETLAGMGSYNPDTTRVLHLESNPLADAVREKYLSEIDSLKQKLEQVEQQLAANSSTTAQGAFTPAPSSHRGSFGSGPSSDGISSIDAQKLHKRLKERFKEQIGLFREGVYLLTGCKIDMSFSDSDCPQFKVRSMYSEREEDHLMFQWQRKKEGEDNDLDLMSTDLAQLLMNGPSAIYMTKFCSVPAFMASVTLGLFEKQTII